MFVLLGAGAASAQSVHTISVPGATHIEAPAVTRLGHWEVAVTFDAERCEISCVYRLRADRFGRTPSYDLLMPPALAIQVQFGARRKTVTVDPARTNDPTAAPEDRGCVADDFLPASRVALVRIEPVAAAVPRACPATLLPSPTRPAVSPLRI